MLSAHSIPVIVGKAVLMALEKRLVFKRFFNADYQGEVTYGGSVKIVSIGAVNVNPYQRYTPLQWQQVEDDSDTLLIDQAESVSIVIDDIDKAQARPEIMAAYIKQSVLDLQDVVDQYLAGVLANQLDAITEGLGSDLSPLDINSENVAALLIRMARLLDDAKVPRENRVCAFPPWFLEKLVLAEIAERTDNTKVAENGMVGAYAGFDLLLSNNTPSGDTDQDDTTLAKIVAGSPISGTMAVQIEKTEIIRLQDYFGSGFRALLVYAGKIVMPETICIATCDEAAES